MTENTQIPTEVPLDQWLPSSLGATVVIPSPETHVSILDDKAILLNLDTGAYHALNSVGTVIWEQFAPDMTLAQIHSAICTRYDVAEDTAREDLVELVIRLYHMGLVQLEKR